MKLTTIIFGLLAMTSMNLASATEVSESDRYIYYQTPWNETLSPIRKEILQKSIDYAVKSIDAKNAAEKAALKEIEENSSTISETLVPKLQKMNEQVGAEFYLDQAVPTAFMVDLGGKFSADWAIGGGISGTVALIIMPVKIVMIDKVDGSKYSTWAAKSALKFIPKIDIGAGIGGGLRGRLGGGLIWGNMHHPNDFSGPAVSGSGNVTYGIGLNIKLGTVLSQQDWSVKFLYAMISAELGPDADAEIHGNLGWVVDISKMFGLVGNVDLSKVVSPKENTP